MTAIAGVHPYADKFPMLPESELAGLAESIRANGLRNPIVITPEGLVLDGRNRLFACERAEVQPVVVVYDGNDLAEFVIDCNSARRHMSTGARAMSTALVLSEDGRRGEGRWRRGSVLGNPESGITSEVKTWQNALNNAGVVLDFAPELAEQVVDGHLALDAAYRTACDARDAERLKLAEEDRIAAEEADSKAFIEQNAPDLAAQVGEVFESYAEAHAVWEKRNREEAARIASVKADERAKEAQRLQVLRDRYNSIANACKTASSWGGYEPDAFQSFMADYDPKLLNPSQLDKYMTVETLTEVMQFAEQLLKWRSSYES